MQKIENINKDLLQYAGIELVEPSDNKGQKLDCYAIYWPDGSLRWLFTVDGFTPGFLAFYSPINFRAKLSTLVMRFIGGLGLMGRFSTKVCDVGLLEEGPIYQALLQCGCDGWALFGGTTGADRKIVVALSQGSVIKNYIKIPISKSSEELVAKEKHNLWFIKSLKLDTVVSPSFSSLGESILLENVNSKGTISTSLLTDDHIRGLRDIYLKTSKLVQVVSYMEAQDFSRKFSDLLSNIPQYCVLDVTSIREISEIALNYVTSQDEDISLTVAFSHCDFTPWNTFIKDNFLIVIDFELAEDEVSSCFDLIHFIMQNDIMCNYQTSKGCREKIYYWLDVFFNREMTEKDKRRLVNLYLLKQVSRYLPLYIQMKEPHKQVLHQLQYWLREFNQEFE
jgi:hypothetical protein